MERKYAAFFGGITFIFMIIGSSNAAGKEYPTRPVHLINPGAPGGAFDISARPIGEMFSESLGQPLVIESKPGGADLVAGNIVATAKPDGYTIGIFPIPPAIPEVYKYFLDSPYSSSDLKPICKLGNFVGVLVAKSDSPWNSINELVEDMRKNPGMKFGAVSQRSSPNLLMLKVAKKEKVSYVVVPHSNEREVLLNVLGGHIPIALVSISLVTGHLQSGSLKALAVYSEKRSELLPEVATFTELGYSPGHYAWFGLFGPKDTPDPIIQKISEVAKTASQTPSYLQKIRNIGFQVAFEGPDQFRETVSHSKADIGKALEEMGFVKK